MNDVHNDVTSEKDLKAALHEAIKRGETLIRLGLPNTTSLAALERMLQETIAAKANASALISVAPRFDWWIEAALWPIYPEGWTVLLRRMPFQGQVNPQVAAAAQQSKLVKG